MLSDGKAGDEGQCLAITDALGLAAERVRVAPRRPFAWTAPWGPADGRDLATLRTRHGGLLDSLPDLLVASGRRAIPYVRALKRASGGRTFTVILKDPRTGARAADLIWVQAHDRLRGPNVIATLTGPHRISAARLAAARADPDPRLAALPGPRAAVLIGGDSRHHRFTPADIDRLRAELTSLAAEASLMVTASRRTPPQLAAALREVARPPRHFLWDGSSENPYLAILALADAVVVSADSTNMVGEAAATGRPVLVASPSGGHPKLDRYLADLARHGAVKPFAGHLEDFTYEPLDSTREIADAVAAAFGRHLAALGRSWPGPQGPR